MKKRFLLGILALIFSIQQTNAMQTPAASLATKLFKYGMIGCGGIVLSVPAAEGVALFFTTDNSINKNIMPADEATKKFVQQTLREYDFPAELIDTLYIGSSLGLSSPTMGFASIGKTIIAPLDKSRLLIAQDLNKKLTITPSLRNQWNSMKHNSANGNFIYDGELMAEEFFLSMQAIMRQLPKDNNLVKHELEMEGNYVGKNSINIWKASLAHEAGHTLQTDSRISKPLAMIGGVLAFRYGIHKSAKLVHNLLSKNNFYKKCAMPNIKNIMTGLGQLPASILSLPGSDIGVFILKKYREYDADSTVLKKVKDPGTLKALAEQIQAHEKITDHRLATKVPEVYNFCLKHPIVFELLDEHQRGSKRAARLLKRAEELEQQRKSN